MDLFAALGWAGGLAADHALLISNRMEDVSGWIMRLLACAAASWLLCVVASAVKSQEGLVNCEAFSSGFSTPEGCIDGSQPSSGPIPANQDVDWGDMPFGWYGPGEWMDF